MGKSRISLAGQLADMDLKLLRVFRTVAEQGGVAAAQEELNIAASTISTYLADLEQRLNMRLCERGRKGFSLTDQGRMVYAAMQELFAAIEQFQGRIHGGSDYLLGELQLGICESTLGLLGDKINQALKDFTDQAPQVDLEIHTLLSYEVIRRVLDGRLALGISAADALIPELDMLLLGEEIQYLYCAPQHPLFERADAQLSDADISAQRFVATPKLRAGVGLRSGSEGWYFQALSAHIEGRVRLIQTGNFIGYLPPDCVRAWGLEQDLRPLLPERYQQQNKYYVVTRKNTFLSPVTEKFLHCARALADGS